MDVRPAPEINETTYEWCVQAFSVLHERLGINVKVHGADGKIDAGQIFLFNHFARFETVIPQYIIRELRSLDPVFGTKPFFLAFAAPIMVSTF